VFVGVKLRQCLNGISRWRLVNNPPHPTMRLRYPLDRRRVGLATGLDVKRVQRAICWPPLKSNHLPYSPQSTRYAHRAEPALSLSVTLVHRMGAWG
jgi:hypothetical protein